ncbi:hypothetical protein [Glycomyces sp. NPDC048151]|uniref:hypothetical protein n=1 Tax=Glycomyces sp. NPDC048151 TaxID=3364002 RepID=UPI00371E5FB7
MWSIDHAGGVMGGNATAVRPRALGIAGAILWAVTGALAAGAVVRVATYGRFMEVSDQACQAVMSLEPPGGWSDNSFPCEQLGPLSWFLPYWAAVAAYAVFATLFLVAAVLTVRSRPAAQGFTLWTAITAVALLAVPGLFDLGRVFAETGANQADTLVAERVHDTFPAWVETVDTVVQALLVAGAVAAVWLLRRPEARAFLKR